MWGQGWAHTLSIPLRKRRTLRERIITGRKAKQAASLQDATLHRGKPLHREVPARARAGIHTSVRNLANPVRNAATSKRETSTDSSVSSTFAAELTHGWRHARNHTRHKPTLSLKQNFSPSFTSPPVRPAFGERTFELRGESPQLTP